MANVIDAVGGLAVFLFGMLTMTDGLKSLAGPSIARVLSRFTRSPWSGALTGAAVTAVIQSSSATTVAAVGFVGAGMLTFSQALGILFGANVGTTFTGWLVAILGFKVDVGTIAPVLVMIGVLLRFTGKPRIAALGLGCAGFGLVFIGIDALRDGLAAFGDRLQPSSFPDNTWFGRVELLLLGALITMVTQSSSAGVVTAMTAVHVGAIELPQAMAMVVGMDIGTTATAALSVIGASTEAKRTGLSHVIYNLMTGAGAFLLIPVYLAIVSGLSGAGSQEHPEVALVLFHTTFNVIGVLAVLPFTAAFARLVMRWIPAEDLGREIRIDRSLLREVPLAVEAASDAVRRLTRMVWRRLARGLLVRQPRSDDDGALSASIAALQTFLADLTTSPDDQERHARHLALMHAMDHLQRMFDRRESRLVPDDTPDDDLSGERQRLAAELLAAARRLGEVQWPSGGSSGEPRRTVKAVAADDAATTNRSAFERAYRGGVLQDAASDRIPDRNALGRIDEARRLSRIGHHLARIGVHLAGAGVLPDLPN